MIKSRKNLTKSQIFSLLILGCLNDISPDLRDDIIKSFENYFQHLFSLSNFMLDDRFKPVTKKKRTRKRTATRQRISQDLAVFMGDVKKDAGPEPATELNPLDIIKLFKQLEGFILRREYTADVNDFKLGRFTTTSKVLLDSLPKLLLDIDSTEDEKVKGKLLTLIFSASVVYRQFKVKSTPDVTTVKAIYSGNKSIQNLINCEFSNANVDKWVKTLNLQSVREYSKLSIYSGNASSPNGGASASNMFKDIAAISKDSKLLNAILALSGHFKGSDEFHLLVNTLVANVQIDEDFTKDAIHSRLFHFTAPGGKARIIANVDWVTQTALSGIHFALFELLSTLPSDCTFNHPSGMSIVDRKPTDSYFSLDLSAATDRMPRHLQAQLISSIWSAMGYQGSDIAKNWLDIVDREYSCEKTAMNNGQPIRYAVGQGMGLFSSWVSMAITHHYIVNHLVGIPTDRYRLVGDDLMFRGTEEEFNRYISTMHDIGININMSKTISSISTDQPTVEFARNYIIDGLKIHPYPIGRLFAWHAEQCSFESSIEILVKSISPDSIYSLSNSLAVLKAENYIEISYYMWDKLNIPYDDIAFLKNLHKFKENTQWVSLESFKKVQGIMLEKFIPNTGISKTIKGMHFLATLESQCVMRNRADLIKSKEISDSILLLSYADDGCVAAANMIHDRLVNAYLVSYDLESIGSPLLSKRERNLLKDVLSSHNKKKRKIDKKE